jgi:murein lipoprotein
MKLNSFFFVVIPLLVIVNGCAKSADVDALAVRVTTLENKYEQVVADVAIAKEAAMDAAAKAALAEEAANRAASYAEQTNTKVTQLLQQQ